MKPKLFIGGGIVIALFLTVSLVQEMNRRWQVQQEVARLTAEVKLRERQAIELENLNQYFGTDDYQERLARENLNYAAEGERVVLIPEEAAPVEVESGEVAHKRARDSVAYRWWSVLFVDERPYVQIRDEWAAN